MFVLCFHTHTVCTSTHIYIINMYFVHIRMIRSLLLLLMMERVTSGKTSS